MKKKGGMEYFIGRRYGDFARMHKKLKTELPGKILPQLPKKNKSSFTASGLMSSVTGGSDDDASSVSSVSTMGLHADGGSIKNLIPRGRCDKLFYWKIILRKDRSSSIGFSIVSWTVISSPFY